LLLCKVFFCRKYYLGFGEVNNEDEKEIEKSSWR
jgi:hypothetical protein